MHQARFNQKEAEPKLKFWKRRWFKIGAPITIILFALAGFAFFRAGLLVNKISTNGNIFGSLAKMVPGTEQKVKGEDQDRINILLLGMRGENVPGGGTLADTIMVASIKPVENKVSFLSVPRDLYVSNPGTGGKSKINAVYAYGMEKGPNGGIENMKQVIGDIVGQPIHYAVVINFKGFTDLVNSIGGVEVDLTKPFEESLQFNEEHVCDAYTFTKPTGKYEYKKDRTSAGRIKIVAAYPLCTNPNTECGGNFKLPAGKQTLTGDQALCYARARKTSSDFDRAKRQQIIIQKIKEKALQLGTLSSFDKVNGVVNSLGNNVKTDLQLWEMKRLFDLQQKMQNTQISQRVLENSNEGLLYNPPSTPETGYILLPIGDNYSKIQEMFNNIFALPQQSDINPK